MNIIDVTNKNYVPVNDLKPLGSDFIHEVLEYRRQFNEVIYLDNEDIASIVETPVLVKKRFIINIELSKHFRFKVKDNDYILYFTKELINGKLKNQFLDEEIKKLLIKYKSNNNDLTIITTFLIKNWEKLLKQRVIKERSMPELNQKHIEFTRQAELGMYYDIKDYQLINSTSYETSRTALEKLTKLNLFRKKKVGKKFVYQLIQNLEGGKYGN